MYRQIQQVTEKHRLQVSTTGHVGNGILQIGLLPEENNSQNGEMPAAIADLAQSARDMGGFFLVENAPPEIKQSYDAFSQRSDYELMRLLKQSFDPKHILNPGRMVRL